MDFLKDNIWLNTLKFRAKTSQQRFDFFFSPQTHLPTNSALIYLGTCFVYLVLLVACCAMLWLSRPGQVAMALLESMFYALLCFYFLETLVRLWFIFFMPIIFPLYFANKCRNQFNYWLTIALFCLAYWLILSTFSTGGTIDLVVDELSGEDISPSLFDTLSPDPLKNPHIFLLFCTVIIPFAWGFVSSKILYYCLKPANGGFDTENLDEHLLADKEKNS